MFTCTKSNYRFSIVCIIIFAVLSFGSAIFASGEPISLFSGAVQFDSYPSGFSDGWYWGDSEIHPHSSHEMLSGEYALGLFYDNIHNGKMQWLNPAFIYPNWPTYTSFVEDTTLYQGQSYRVWNNNTAAQSRVYDPNVQVTIDYRLLNLGDGNSVVLPYRDSNGTKGWASSESIVFLHTYTIKNKHSIGDSNITGLQLFQFLHGHPADAYSGTNSIYSNLDNPGILKDPCNPSKSFRYAICQWNNGDVESENGHVDFMSFSSTVQPNWIDNGFFNGGHFYYPEYKPERPGTHWNIEDCNLNGILGVYNCESAGAMGWALPDLPPQQSTSMTIAVVWGCAPISLTTGPVHNITKNTHHSNIQAAANKATDEDIIVVDPGTYNESVNLGSKNLTIRSTDPNNRSIIESTIIQSESAAVFSASANTSPSAISGFTLRSNSQNLLTASGSKISFSKCLFDSVSHCINAENSCIDLASCELKTSSDALHLAASDANVVSCVLSGKEYNSGYGIYAMNSDSNNISVSKSHIKNFTYNGIFVDRIHSLKASNNKISDCGSFAIYLTTSAPSEIINNILSNSHTGIRISNSTNLAHIIRNNTITRNTDYGLFFENSSDPSIVKNCIIADNPTQINLTKSNVSYCCIPQASPYPGTANIIAQPCFVSAADFHLLPNSPCKNTGNGTYTETDIDGENRCIGTIDIGADEFSANGDFNYDGITNFIDFSVFANGWRTFNQLCNLDASDSLINNKDLRVFALSWLAHYEIFSPGLPPYADGLSSLQLEASSPELILTNELESQTPSGSIWLAYDGNSLNVEPNDIVTVDIYTDTTLFCMDVLPALSGSAEMVGAMSSADANDFGWDASDWPCDPYLDPNDLSWTNVSGVIWASTATGHVGYFQFRYLGGQVTVSVPEAYIYDANCLDVPFTTSTLIFGRDPNE